MLKPIAIGMLLATTGFAGVALAQQQQTPSYSSPWTNTYSKSSTWSSDNDWSSVVNDAQLPKAIRDWCASNHQQCNQYEDWAESYGWWKDSDDGGAVPAPEADPAGAMGALTILAAGLAILRGRRTPSKSV
jgi:hypothetical protein